MDTVSKDRRSEIMALVKAKDTRPEIFVRRLLHRLGYRFRLHRNDLPGRPDLVLPKHRTVVFVHGCFWHRHPGCANTRTPKSRIEFWTAKFEGNVRRDQEAQRLLQEQGWRILVIWECELADVVELTDRIERFLRGGGECGRSNSSPAREG